MVPLPDSVTYKGRGTVIATPKGNYLIYLRAKNLSKTSATDEEGYVFVIDGTGVVRTSDYINNASKDLKPPKYKWELIGYTHILPGKLEVRE
jgi:hypothetical protein